jgi:hypothetical protein
MDRKPSASNALAHRCRRATRPRRRHAGAGGRRRSCADPFRPYAQTECRPDRRARSVQATRHPLSAISGSEPRQSGAERASVRWCRGEARCGVAWGPHAHTRHPRAHRRGCPRIRLGVSLRRSGVWATTVVVLPGCLAGRGKCGSKSLPGIVDEAASLRVGCWGVSWGLRVWGWTRYGSSMVPAG